MKNLIEIYNFLKTLNTDLENKENKKYISTLKEDLKEKIFNDLIKKELEEIKRQEGIAKDILLRQQERDGDRCEKCDRRDEACYC